MATRAEVTGGSCDAYAEGGEGVVLCGCCCRPLRIAFVRSGLGWHGEVVCTGCGRSEPHCNCLWSVPRPWNSPLR